MSNKLVVSTQEFPGGRAEIMGNVEALRQLSSALLKAAESGEAIAGPFEDGCFVLIRRFTGSLQDCRALATPYAKNFDPQQSSRKSGRLSRVVAGLFGFAPPNLAMIYGPSQSLAGERHILVVSGVGAIETIRLAILECIETGREVQVRMSAGDGEPYVLALSIAT